jgi:hypothetical protein
MHFETRTKSKHKYGQSLQANITRGRNNKDIEEHARDKKSKKTGVPKNSGYH